MYYKCFDQMRISRQTLKPFEGSLVGFNGEAVEVEGLVELPVTLKDGNFEKMVMLEFCVVKLPSAYNVILGTLRGNHKVARQCYFASLSTKSVEVLHTDDIKDAKPDKRMDIRRRPDSVDKFEPVNLFEGNLEKAFLVGTELEQGVREALIAVLRKNTSAFAWSAKDMPGIDPSIMHHRLSVKADSMPIRQKKRNFALDRQEAIQEEVSKLMEAGFIREVYYPDWLTNVVMVRKQSGKWRMCVDFTNLNEACPKDSFPLPRIDRLVDSSSGNELLSFMDAYVGYNQIKLAEEDEEKTLFITETGTYCFKVMPIGLKNAGATYQLWLKLSLTKCTFEVSAGKFLGFMITAREIEANPSKIEAVLGMQSPRSTKEVQRLTGRITGLARFMSKSADICFPFFQTLKKAFSWTDKCEVAFQQLKEYLAAVPILGKSVEGEALILYLGASAVAAHTVEVRTDQPLKKTLHKPNTSGRMVQWSVELGEFDIRYSPRTAIKAQALADFIVECTFSSENSGNLNNESAEYEGWLLYVDGLSDKLGGGARATLWFPDGQITKCAIKFDFPASNNAAEYEALILGLRWARATGADELRVFL
ncbi:Retrovirus-related Pol polyprotein from transposon 17.6 [Quillaja saponaria]|uniref:Retrovirus-related Pol polyprotein from transposon 17.6 n=1 Tax=Quillaja saponaria TaxID=32244 RepID=A0AAD7KP00_QUISA|nr:Retrovirus-related Pol polyprotein from transposon 17.6 [Quillaja saponaria]